MMGLPAHSEPGAYAMTDDRTLTTERLVLRPLALEDAPALHSIYSHPDAMRHWHTPPHERVDETREMVSEELRRDGQQWTIWHRADDRAIGVTGYLGNPGVPGFGYILHPDYWGRGYMTEAAGAALEYGFIRMGLDRVELWITEDNLASQRLAQRLGFTYRGRFRVRYHHNAASHENRVYGLTVEEWRAIRSDGQPISVHTAPPCYRVEPILAVPDVQQAAEWYRDRLEFTLDWLYGDPPTHGAVSLGQWTTEGARIQLSRTSEAISPTPGLALYLFVSTDIDARYARYQKRGVEIARPLDDYPWEMREFTVRDPHGYLLRFGTRM
jgi:RimJ/RimL family protein N-acetyltransferase/uncharacterized glyoxalase superfamily protein PhnB